MGLLITGGCGFIGSNFVRYVLDKHPTHTVINLDKLTYAGNTDNLRDVEEHHKPRYEFVKGDICDKRLVRRLMEHSDMVVHFAAETHVDNSIKSADEFMHTNVFGTYNLLNAAREMKIKRFLYVSTDEVYGSIEEGKFSEDSPVAPNNPYSASKAGADLMCRAYFRTFDLPVIITRSANNLGPYQHPEKLIPKFVINAMLDKPLPLYGDGMHSRDWIYVEDNCAAIDFALQNGDAGEVYNIGGDNEHRNIDITKKILKILNKPESLINHVTDRPGHDRRYALSSSKIKGLGWKPRFKFDDALNNTVNWYKENKWWWEKLRKE
ncbi:dTDP-glucose 4,6-dehydratase [Candidatus Woesearchaeota archaeon CG08_land_8_20_14_0_20_47_9]|nr:MAG: dTDP-glucose 4,6-dehydratase [Candidatus Woesearchaeota archaeon CG1_02_47_18]PIO04467.1 MAG: dTDP-glucose 4,6-dehydratase [Candidatus Woesearchaeota archaeon CG08_land_8_20_14_0_20_47_9]HII30335.1 dTDP-glucose 4,6-dehydratase [Candidatus Woesearchaeota archaeon]